MTDLPYSRTLQVDLYQLTMSQAYLHAGMTGQATFSLSFRGYPKDRGFYASAGQETALEILQGFRFTEADLDYIESTALFDQDFLAFLEDVRFTGSVRAVSEGTVIFADEPVLEITAPLIEAQLVETALLNAVTFQTAALTKAARIKHAANGAPVVEFGARRAQGQEAADIASRCSAIAGFAATSNLHAASRYGLTVAGTMAHSFVQSFNDELAAFRAYVAEFPDSATLLVDTYDTGMGIANAITVAGEMAERGEKLQAIRLDSGNLADLAEEARSSLDAAGLNDLKIIATGGLDEHSISELVEARAPIDSFGVGTRFVVSADAPYLDSVYKLAAYDGRPTNKLSPGKMTLPGAKQVFRTSANGQFTGDVIGIAGETAPAGTEPLLEKVMENGVIVCGQKGGIPEARERLRTQLSMLPDGVTALRNPERYPVTISPDLERLRREISDSAG